MRLHYNYLEGGIHFFGDFPVKGLEQNIVCMHYYHESTGYNCATNIFCNSRHVQMLQMLPAVEPYCAFTRFRCWSDGLKESKKKTTNHIFKFGTKMYEPECPRAAKLTFPTALVYHNSGARGL